VKKGPPTLKKEGVSNGEMGQNSSKGMGALRPRVRKKFNDFLRPVDTAAWGGEPRKRLTPERGYGKKRYTDRFRGQNGLSSWGKNSSKCVGSDRVLEGGKAKR